MSFDPFNNALSTIRNASDSGRLKCTIKPASKLIGRALKVMQEHDYISAFEYVDNGKGGIFEVSLNGNINKCGAIKPRFSVSKNDFEKWEKKFLPGKNFGILLVSTSEGVISHEEAQERKTNGKLLAYIF